MKILYGKKVVLFPFQYCDEADWRRLLEEEGKSLGESMFKSFEDFFQYTLCQIRMGLWQVWAGETSNLGKERNKKIGFVALHDYNPGNRSVCINGMMDKEIAKGLIPLLKREDKMTYAEDSLRQVIKFVFEGMGLHRIGADCVESNRLSRKLIEKVGFKKEGVIRDAWKIGEKFENLLVYGLLNEKEVVK